MSIVEVKNLTFSYGDDIKALDDVSIKIEEGSYTTIIGHNGSGKSTLAKLMAGLLPITSGEIVIEDRILNLENITAIRQDLGIVFQNPDNQFIGSSVRDDIAFGLENHEVDPSKMDQIIERFASVVDMSEFLDKEPNNLSGGQKQRVAIAGVLAMGPKIIIFDEATSMLDPQGKEEIKKVIYDLHTDQKMTIISITHDIEEALKSDHVIVLEAGRKVLDGDPLSVLSNYDKLFEISLDVPFTFKVAKAFKDRGYDIEKTKDLEGLVDAICQLDLKK